MEKFEETIDQAAALGALMGASGHLMQIIGVDIDVWSTDWVHKTDAENLVTVRERIVTAVAYIQERK